MSEEKFKHFMENDPHLVANMISYHNSPNVIVEMYRHLFFGGYRAGLEAVGDVLAPDESEEIKTLKKEISQLKGQITKLKKAK